MAGCTDTDVNIQWRVLLAVLYDLENMFMLTDRGHTMTGLIRSSVKRAVGSVVPPEEGAVCNSRTSIQMHLLSRIEEMEISGAIEFVVGCFYV